MSYTIFIQETTECPHCGTARSRIDAGDFWLVKEFMSDAYGMHNPREYVRAMRETPNGVTFEHGGGYGVVDEDLLGGTGDGKRESVFLKWAYGYKGEPISFYRKNARSHKQSCCRECAKCL